MIILFVCTGNTCRSPMAAAIARHYVSENGYEVSIKSAGIKAEEGALITPAAGQALSEYGVPYAHISTRLNFAHLNRTDIVYCMDNGHLDAVSVLAASLPMKVRPSIKLFDEPNEIPDPIGQDIQIYRAFVRNFLSLIPQKIPNIETAKVKLRNRSGCLTYQWV